MNQPFWHKLPRLFKFGDDQAPDAETIHNIEQGITFQGAKLWVLIMAIFVASLGLNTNSTAVIIGAMLISPLMGPILGLGLGLGIQDPAMIHKSIKNYLLATIFSVATATIYFLLSPFSEAQSELLARTSPTIYDVLIAFCGGLAGIIALSSRSQRAGNVIPGVAIATALMPPLCTAGFGLATANWRFALGALYLYLINTVFIALATYIGVSFIFRFGRRSDTSLSRRFNYILTTIGLFVIVPSLYLTIDMVRESIFRTNAHHFATEAIQQPDTHVIGTDISYDQRTIRLVLMGQEVDTATIAQLHTRLADYNLHGTTLTIVQGARSLTEDAVKHMLTSTEQRIAASTQVIARDQTVIDSLQAIIARYHQLEALTHDLLPEVQTIYPQVSALTLARGTTATADSLPATPTILALYQLRARITPDELTRLKQWLRLKVGEDVIIEERKAN